MINYTTDIVDGFFYDNIGEGIPSTFSALTDGQKRILTIVLITSAYIGAMASPGEGKLAHTVIKRMLDAAKTGVR